MRPLSLFGPSPPPRPLISRHRRASATTSASPSSLPSVSSSGSMVFSLISRTMSITSVDLLIVSMSFWSPDSRSCSSVQIAMCWKVASPEARKRWR